MVTFYSAAVGNFHSALDTNGAKLKKAQLADLAEKELQGTGWIPLPVRTMIAADGKNGGCAFQNEDLEGEDERGEESAD